MTNVNHIEETLVLADQTTWAVESDEAVIAYRKHGQLGSELINTTPTVMVACPAF